jgi:AraC-like DNA-binding protein
MDERARNNALHATFLLMSRVELQASNCRMTSLLTALATLEGIRPTAIEGIQLMRASQPIPRMQVLYEPGIVIVGQGRKRGYLGDQVFTYDAHNYLVLSVPLPFECETEASPEEPMLAVSIRVDLAVLGELLMKMDGVHGSPNPSVPQGIYSTELDLKLSETTVRLLECLSNPAETRILGPQIVREITYRVLCGEQGGALRAAAALHSRFGQVNRTVLRIHAEYARDLTVEELAETAGMSASAFHQNFKAVTSTSPLQYLKTIRLHKARMLMVHEGLRAGLAAERVGYESSSQFSREFKRLFGSTPIEETDRVRRMLGVAEPAVMAMER